MSKNKNNERIMNLSIRDLFFVNSSAINILIPIVIVLFIRLVPQANHIVFSKLAEIDPISTTMLVMLYSIFTMFIYYTQEIKYKEDGSDNLDLSKVYQIVNLVSHFIPLAVWLTIVFFNQRSDHLISIIITLAVIILNVFLITSSLKYRILIQSNISYLVYLITLTMLIWGAYMFNDFPGTTSSIWVPILIYVLLAVILIISIIFIDDRVLADKYSKIIAVIIILSIAIIVKAGHKIIFTPINIFLLYALTLRIILFLISRSMIIIDEWIHAADNIPINTRIHLISRKTMTERVLVIICTFCFLFILFKRATMDQHDINVMEANNIRNSFREYVVNWLRADTTQAPIFLITGQGGGSRAGSVFFQTLSELDPILNNNLLSINTISGSGTGAQFYLSAKFSLGDKYPDVFKQTSNITKANKILYQQDYISSALFKILFTDYIRSKFIRHPSPSSRNYELMKLESDQYDHLVDSFNFKAQQMDSLKYLNSDWGQVYNPTKMKNNKFPLFFPVSYNVPYGIKAISSPVVLPINKISPFYDILGSLGSNRNLKVIQSVALNQLFPIMSATATLDSLNYMDGGVYDNLGFETLFDLYRITTKLRDSLASNRRIILLSIENGGYEPSVNKDKLFDLSAVSKAASSSIFSTVPRVHKDAGLKSLYCQDTFFQLRVYMDTVVTKESIWNFFQYRPNKDEVIMSRYLTASEIEFIAVRSKSEVVRFKQKMEAFLSRPPQPEEKECYRMAPVLTDRNINNTVPPSKDKNIIKKKR